MMEFDPFYLRGGVGLTGVAAVHRDGAYALDFMAAIATGGFCALLFSLWKSRQRKADGIDTSLWALIGLIGSMGLAFFLAPALDGRTILLIGITLPQPLATFLIALGAKPFPDRALTGVTFKQTTERRGVKRHR